MECRGQRLFTALSEAAFLISFSDLPERLAELLLADWLSKLAERIQTFRGSAYGARRKP